MNEITYRDLSEKSLNNTSLLVINKSKGIILASECILSNTFAKRFLGLMFKKNLPTGKGLIIVPCDSIHTFFMKFPIDVIFLNKNQTAVRIKQNLAPGKIILPAKDDCESASFVIELPAGTISETGTEAGDYIGLFKN